MPIVVCSILNKYQSIFFAKIIKKMYITKFIQQNDKSFGITPVIKVMLSVTVALAVTDNETNGEDERQPLGHADREPDAVNAQ